MKIRIKTDKPMEWSSDYTDDEIIYNTAEEDEHPFLKRIGPDVLNESCSYKLIEERLTS